MIKACEATDPQSCFNRALDDEMMFVLLARDIVAPRLVRMWVLERIAYGKNKWGDKQITEALECADRMEHQQAAGIRDRARMANA